jgi:hypothetical protein
MKKMGDYMKEIGFNPDASFEAKKAFIKYLVKEASSYDRITDIQKYREVESEEDSNVKSEDIKIGEQLSLFDRTGTE